MNVNATLENFSITLSQTSFEAGTYRFNATSVQGGHDFVIDGANITAKATPVLNSGQSATLEVTLPKGTYTIWCSVGNHRAMGMEITITVT